MLIVKAIDSLIETLKNTKLSDPMVSLHVLGYRSISIVSYPLSNQRVLVQAVWPLRFSSEKPIDREVSALLAWAKETFPDDEYQAIERISEAAPADEFDSSLFRDGDQGPQTLNLRLPVTWTQFLVEPTRTRVSRPYMKDGAARMVLEFPYMDLEEARWVERVRIMLKEMLTYNGIEGVPVI